MYNLLTVWLLRFVVSVFVVAVLVSICLYPGGNIHDSTQAGYSLTHNFLSDLGGYKSQSGEINFLSSFFFNVSMFMFVGVGVSFLFVPRLFKNDPVSYALAVVGSGCFFIGTIFFGGVGLTPHDLYLELHLFFAVNAFRFLVPGSLAYLVVLFRSPLKNSYGFVTMFYLACTTGYVVYQLLSGSALDSSEEMIRQATIQKAIVAVSVATIFSLSFAFSAQLKAIGLR